MEERLARSTACRLALYALLAAAMVWPLLEVAAYTNDFRDAQVLGLHERAAVAAVARFHELPLWNPYYCGGLYALGAPQSRHASPAFLATLLFGVERAQPVIVFALSVLGMEGTFRWLRLRIASDSAAARIAPVFALSGQFAVAAYRGWTTFFGFELLPWVLLGVTLAAQRRARGIVIASLAFAFILGFGGTFAAPLVAIAATVEAARAIVELPGRDRARAIVPLVATAIFMATVSAVRLWPIAETLAAAPRIMAGTPGHPGKELLTFLWGTLEVKDGDVGDVGSFHVGVLFLALAAAGAGIDRRAIPPLVLAIAFVWVAAGYERKPSAFAALREIPGLSGLRYPERFLWISVLLACEPAARFLEALPRLGETLRWRRSSSALLTVVVLVTVVSELVTFRRAALARDLGAIAPGPAGAFHQARGNRWLAAYHDGLDVGSLSCWETHPVRMSPRLRGDLEAEEYLADPAAGTVSRVAWSPNRLALHVVLARPTRALVNQNWHPGWTASSGVVVSDEGRIAVELGDGTHDVVLRFLPRSAWGGAIVTGTALAALAAMLLRARRVPFAREKDVVTASLALAPIGIFGLVLATSREPPFPPSPPRNANGTPAIVTTVEDAPRVTGHFPVAVTLEAARVSPLDEVMNVRIDVYFRRTGPLGRADALFAHVRRRKDEPPPPERGQKRETYHNLDHHVIAGTFYLGDAPQGELVHDSFGVNLAKSAPGAWDVTIGFGPLGPGKTKQVEMVQVGTVFVP